MAKKTQKKNKKGGMNFLTYQFTDAYKFANATNDKVSKMMKEMKKNNNSDPEVMKYVYIFYECSTIKLYLEKASTYKYSTKDKLYELITKYETTVPHEHWLPGARVQMNVVLHFFNNKIYIDGKNPDANIEKYISMPLKDFIKTEGPELLKKKFMYMEEEIKSLIAEDTDKSRKYADDMEVEYLIAKIYFLSKENTAENNEFVVKLKERAQELKEKFEKELKIVKYNWELKSHIKKLTDLLNSNPVDSFPPEENLAGQELVPEELVPEGQTQQNYISGDDSGSDLVSIEEEDEETTVGGRKRAKTRRRAKTHRCAKTRKHGKMRRRIKTRKHKKSRRN